MDEGWTRFLLEQFDFPYSTLKDKEIKSGALNSRYDVIILPDDTTDKITGERKTSDRDPQEGLYPPEYRSGIGEDGVEALRDFVTSGGILVALGGATEFAIDKLDLKVRNVVNGMGRKDFFCPGSTLQVTFSNDHPLAYGMPPEGLVLFWNSPAFAVIPSHHNDHYQTIVRYKEDDILQSGWLIGENYLSKKAAMISAKCGQGTVVLIGFRTQNRAQTHGTFKLLFNALLQ